MHPSQAVMIYISLLMKREMHDIVMRIGTMIDHDVPAERYVHKIGIGWGYQVTM